MVSLFNWLFCAPEADTVCGFSQSPTHSSRHNEFTSTSRQKSTLFDADSGAYTCNIVGAKFKTRNELVVDFEVTGDLSKGALQNPSKARLLTPYREFLPTHYVQESFYKGRENKSPLNNFPNAGLTDDTELQVDSSGEVQNGAFNYIGANAGNRNSANCIEKMKETYVGSLMYTLSDDIIAASYSHQTLTEGGYYHFEFSEGWTILNLDGFLSVGAPRSSKNSQMGAISPFGSPASSPFRDLNGGNSNNNRDFESEYYTNSNNNAKSNKKHQPVSEETIFYNGSFNVSSCKTPRGISGTSTNNPLSPLQEKRIRSSMDLFGDRNNFPSNYSDNSRNDKNSPQNNMLSIKPLFNVNLKPQKPISKSTYHSPGNQDSPKSPKSPMVQVVRTDILNDDTASSSASGHYQGKEFFQSTKKNIEELVNDSEVLVINCTQKNADIKNKNDYSNLDINKNDFSPIIDQKNLATLRLLEVSRLGPELRVIAKFDTHGENVVVEDFMLKMACVLNIYVKLDTRFGDSTTEQLDAQFNKFDTSDANLTQNTGHLSKFNEQYGGSTSSTTNILRHDEENIRLQSARENATGNERYASRGFATNLRNNSQSMESLNSQHSKNSKNSKFSSQKHVVAKEDVIVVPAKEARSYVINNGSGVTSSGSRIVHFIFDEKGSNLQYRKHSATGENEGSVLEEAEILALQRSLCFHELFARQPIGNFFLKLEGTKFKILTNNDFNVKNIDYPSIKSEKGICLSNYVVEDGAINPQGEDFTPSAAAVLNINNLYSGSGLSQPIMMTNRSVNQSASPLVRIRDILDQQERAQEEKRQERERIEELILETRKNSSNNENDNIINSTNTNKLSAASVTPAKTDTCIVCLSNPVDATFIHGNTGHNVCCTECAFRLWYSAAEQSSNSNDTGSKCAL